MSGDPVPINVPISSIDMISTVDTLPRGEDDPGNEVRTNLNDSTFYRLDII